jgi:uncharacterized RDD family membrane protein YckC
MDYGGTPIAATTEKAGFLVRVVAYIIDFIILGVVQGILQVILGQSAAGGISTLISIAYFVYFWTSTGATPGDQVMGLRVVSTDGSPISYGKAFIRWIGYIISIIPIGLGFLWVIWDANKQGWHDKIAGTYVVKTR